MTKINITVPEEFLKKIDRTARAEKTTRSELLRRSVETYWRFSQEERALRRRARQVQAAMDTQEKLRRKAGDWDAVAEIRKWRDAR